MNNIFYIYHLISPFNNLPFYIGKGHSDRMYSHEKEVKSNLIPNGNLYLFNKIKNILDNNKKIIYKKIKENLLEKEAFELESMEIKKYGRKNIKTGILCNMTDGGEGVSGLRHTKFTKEKISKALKESNHSLIMRTEKVRNNMSKAHLGKKRSKEICLAISLGQMGRIISNETRKKISESNKGRKCSEVTRKKMSEAHKNKIVSQSTRDKLKLINKGRKHTKEQIEANRQRGLGRKMSKEVKNKMSQSHKLRFKKNPKLSLEISQKISNYRDINASVEYTIQHKITKEIFKFRNIRKFAIKNGFPQQSLWKMISGKGKSCKKFILIAKENVTPINLTKISI